MSRPPRYLDERELEAFMGAVESSRHAHATRDRALFALLALAGIRPSEALALTRADLRLAPGLAWIRVVRLKKRRPQPQIAELEIAGPLASLLRLHAWGLSPAARVFDLTRRQAHRRFMVYAGRAGLSPHRTLYDLRHTAATRFYLQTRDIRVVQHLLGHESPSTTSIYAHVPKSVLAWTAEHMPSFI